MVQGHESPCLCIAVERRAACALDRSGSRGARGGGGEMQLSSPLLVEGPQFCLPAGALFPNALGGVLWAADPGWGFYAV